MSTPSDTPVQKLDYGWWTFAFTIGIFIRSLVLRMRVRAVTPPPAEGAVLFLGNHTAFSDPIVLALAVRRPVHFMASEQLFRNERSGKWVRRLHAFPKAKYARDKDAITKVVEHNAAGRAIGLFPEGNRSWDGSALPIRPGLGWLLKKMDGPVVFVRNRTGWMFQPRWAKYPRWVPIQVELSEPVTYPEDWTTAQIEEDVQARLAFDSDAVQVDGGVWGFRMAHGLPSYLWSCPSCFGMESLAVDASDQDVVACSSCGAAWRVDVACRLNPVRGDARPMSVADAYLALTDHFGELPTVDRDRFIDTGVALTGPVLSISSVDQGSLTAVTSGKATLTSDALTVGDWSLPLKSIKAVSIELGDVLQVRTADELFQLDSNTPLLWGHFLAAHHAASSPRRRSRRR